jgi:hypothetical protein
MKNKRDPTMPGLRRTLVSIVIGVVLASSVAAARRDDTVAALPTVQRWRDLLAVTPIKLDDAVRIRIGIESKNCPVAQGRLLYVLTDGFQPPTTWNGIDRVGPVRVQYGPSGQARSNVQALATRAATDAGTGGRLLFACPIPMPSENSVAIRVFTLDDRIIAKGTLRPTESKAHGWMPLARVQVAAERPDKHIPRLALYTNGQALPHWDPMLPLVFDGDADGQRITRSEDDRLPTLVPTYVDSGWNVTTYCTDMGQRRLVISSQEEFITARPDWHLLGRWWVNGEPYLPKPLETTFSDQNGMVRRGRCLEIQLDFDRKRIGAKPGDRIELQLMYLEHGWRWIADFEMLQASHGRLLQLPVLLNKVQWVE